MVNIVKNNLEVEEYKFNDFSKSINLDKSVVEYEFKKLANNFSDQLKKQEQTIKLERNFAKVNEFKVNPIVEEHRGLKKQAEEDYLKDVNREVELKIQEIQEEAYQAGFNEGVNQGREEIYSDMRNVIDQKLDVFTSMINNILTIEEEILTKQKNEMYALLNNLTKWIILRELKDDGQYVERLLEKILTENQLRKNLLIQVGKKDYQFMPEIIDHVSKKLGELSNVRVEIDPEISSSGIVVEADSGIIDGRLDEQFKSLDKLFNDLITV